jgi:hypothetical protein
MANAYPVVAVNINGVDHQVPLTQGDYVRLEQQTKMSVRRLDWSIEHIVTIGYFAARRSKLIPADMSLDDWIDSTESHLVPDVDGEGKALGQDQPTG